MFEFAGQKKWCTSTKHRSFDFGTTWYVSMNIDLIYSLFGQIFFILFLSLFSYVLLIDFLPMNIHDEKNSSGSKKFPLPIAEIILHVWIWSLIIEEIRQVRRF